MRVFTTASLLIGLLLTGCAGMSPQDDSFGQQHMVFISSRSGANDVYLADLNGRHVRALTDDATDDASPRFSPDGRVVFASRRNGSWQIYSMNWDGSGVKALTKDTGVNNYRPFPGPDGRIVFVTDRFQKPQIMSINPDGTDLRRLTHTEDYYDSPVVGLDGMIYFTSSRSSKWEVWRMFPDGGKPEQLTQTPRNIKEVAVLPPDAQDQIKRTTNRSLLLNPYGFYTQPKLIYTMASDSGGLSLYRTNLDGSDPRNITANQLNNDRSPMLAPNGRLYFTSDRGGSTDIWSMTPDGYQPTVIIDHPAYDSTM
jgi:Tol biopolymer transport system component